MSRAALDDNPQLVREAVVGLTVLTLLLGLLCALAGYRLRQGWSSALLAEREILNDPARLQAQMLPPLPPPSGAAGRRRAPAPPAPASTTPGPTAIEHLPPPVERVSLLVPAVEQSAPIEVESSPPPPAAIPQPSIAEPRPKEREGAQAPVPSAVQQAAWVSQAPVADEPPDIEAPPRLRVGLPVRRPDSGDTTIDPAPPAELPASQAVYTVAEGETLFDIARRELGQAARYVEIYRLNEAALLRDFNHPLAGAKLIMPPDWRAAGPVRATPP